MVYSSEVTKEHPLAKDFALNLNELIKSEGGKGIFPNYAVSISLDNVEKGKRKASPNSTMDIAIGVCSRESLPEIKNKKIVMCEFRFNYRNWKNISKSELENKVNYSRTLLQESFIGQIDNRCFFLFDKSIFEQVKNHLARLYNNRIKERIVLTEEQFKEMFF